MVPTYHGHGRYQEALNKKAMSGQEEDQTSNYSTYLSRYDGVVEMLLSSTAANIVHFCS